MGSSEFSKAGDTPEIAGDAAAGLLQCLLLVAELEGCPASEPAIVAGLPLEGGALTPALFLRAANRAGLAARLVQRPLADIPRDVLPAIICFRDGGYGVLTDIDPALGFAVLMSPVDRLSRQLDIDVLQKRLSGEVYYLRPMQQFDRRAAGLPREGGQHWFWGVIKSSMPIYRDVLIASFFINLFALAQPLFVMNVYDRVVPNNAVETLWALAIGVLIVYLFDMVLKTLRSYFVEMAAKRSDVILSSMLFEKVMGLKMQFRPGSVGAFTNRLQDFESIRGFITSSCILTIVDLPFMVIFLVLIGWLAGWLVAVPILAIPVAVFLGFRAQRRLRPITEKIMAAATKKNATLVESVMALETIKFLGAEGRTQRDWEQAVGYTAQWGLQGRRISNSTLYGVQWLQQITMVLMVVWGAYMIGDQALTMGGLIACVMLHGRVMAPLGQVASLITNYDHAQVSLNSLTEIMNFPSEREQGKRYLHKLDFKGDIDIKQVAFTYGEQSPAVLDGVSFAIRAGEKVGIIGRLGSGKSTLARLMLRLYDPQQGTILLDGIDLQQLDPADLRAKVGYVAQDVMLFQGTLRDNITLGLDGVSDEALIASAQQAGIMDMVNEHPLGFNMPVGERGDTLSGGQRQAVSLARAFLREPPILILDEPTSAMDQGSEARVRQQLQGFASDKTLLLITHKMSMLELVDRLIVMDRGQVIADGAKSEVLEALRSGAVRGAV
ncbi:MAG: type I secretion system permease/ATPase [Porticoccaceae bacterium]